MKALFTITLLFCTTTTMAGEMCHDGHKFIFNDGDLKLTADSVEFTSYNGRSCEIFLSDNQDWNKCARAGLVYAGTCAGTIPGNDSPIIHNNRGSVTITFSD